MVVCISYAFAFSNVPDLDREVLSRDSLVEHYVFTDWSNGVSNV